MPNCAQNQTTHKTINARQLGEYTEAMVSHPPTFGLWFAVTSAGDVSDLLRFFNPPCTIEI
jgi:hypothetical protein